jgi:hypothetical protein
MNWLPHRWIHRLRSSVQRRPALRSALACENAGRRPSRLPELVELEVRAAPSDSLASILFLGPVMGIGESLLQPELAAAVSRARGVPAASASAGSRLPAPAANHLVSSDVVVLHGPASNGQVTEQASNTQTATRADTDVWSATGIGGHSLGTLAGLGDFGLGGSADSKAIDSIAAATAGLMPAASHTASASAGGRSGPAENATASTASSSVSSSGSQAAAVNGAALAKLAVQSGINLSGRVFHAADDPTVGTTTSATPGAISVIFGQTFSINVTVTADDGEIPTGDVEYLYNGTVLGAVGLNAQGQSAVPLGGAILPVGVYALQIQYVPTTGSQFQPSSAGVNVVVNAAQTETLIGSSLNPSVYGQSVTFTAIVLDTQTTQIPDGNITFLIGSGMHQFTKPLSGVQAPAGGFTFDGVFIPGSTWYATTTVTVAGEPDGLYAGAPSATAEYFGDSNPTGSNFTPTEGSMNETVNSATTSTISHGGTFVYGQPITVAGLLSVTNPPALAPGVPPPSGDLTFTFGTLGQTFNGSAFAPDGSSQISSASLPNLVPGTYPYTAAYGGQMNSTGGGIPDFAGSSFDSSIVVNKGGTSVLLSSSANPTFYPDSVTFTANLGVVAPAVGVPTGTITFYVNGVAKSTVTLTSSETATYSAAYPTLNLGNNTIAAVYIGDTDFAGSTGSLTQDYGL